MSPRLNGWYRSTFGHAAVGAAVLWAALPPWDLWLLAWIAPLWWVLLIRRHELPGQELLPERKRTTWILVCLAGSLLLTVLLWLFGVRRPPPPFMLVGLFLGMVPLPWLLHGGHPYRALWLVGFLFWLAALHWLRLPHWTTCFGWVALSFYLAFYLPAFVGLSRLAVHRLHVPVILAAPVVWTGLELARGHLLTGFTMASLGHTQYHWIRLIQLSDLAGAYGVSFVVMFVAACLGRMIPCQGRPAARWPLVPAVAVVAAAVLYGHFRLSDPDGGPAARVALIQGCIDTQIKADPNQREEIFWHYFQLSRAGLRESGDVDLVVWPETMFRNTLFTYDQDVEMPEDFQGTEAEFRKRLQDEAGKSRGIMAQTAQVLDVPLILGVDRDYFGTEGVQCFNSAVWVAASGELIDCYDKMHLVVCGEYVPLAEYFPWVHRLMPMKMDLSEGTRPVAFTVASAAGPLRLAPNICYETVIPHVIRKQVNTLKAEGAEPHALVNLTNDGWFRGSSELDMHLVCGVFRAVECRKPLLIAANTGFSAWIDGDGRIRQQGRRRDTDVIVAGVCPDRRRSWYLQYGDWPAGICLAACVLFGVVGGWRKVRRGRPRRKPSSPND